jgi:hypothetical protein
VTVVLPRPATGRWVDSGVFYRAWRISARALKLATTVFVGGRYGVGFPRCSRADLRLEIAKEVSELKECGCRIPW